MCTIDYNSRDAGKPGTLRNGTEQNGTGSNCCTIRTWMLDMWPEICVNLNSSFLCTGSDIAFYEDGTSTNRELVLRARLSHGDHLGSNMPRIFWRVNWVSDEWRRGSCLFLACCLERPKTCLSRTRPNLCSHLLH